MDTTHITDIDDKKTLDDQLWDYYIDESSKIPHMLGVVTNNNNTDDSSTEQDRAAAEAKTQAEDRDRILHADIVAANEARDNKRIAEAEAKSQAAAAAEKHRMETEAKHRADELTRAEAETKRVKDEEKRRLDLVAEADNLLKERKKYDEQLTRDRENLEKQRQQRDAEREREFEEKQRAARAEMDAAVVAKDMERVAAAERAQQTASDMADRARSEAETKEREACEKTIAEIKRDSEETIARLTQAHQAERALADDPNSEINKQKEAAARLEIQAVRDQADADIAAARAKADSDVGDAQRLLNDCRAELEKLRARQADLQNNTGNEIKDRDQKIAELSDIIQQNTDRMEDLQRQGAQIPELAEHLAKLTAENERLAGEARRFGAEKDEFKATNDENQTRIRELETQIEMKQAELADIANRGSAAELSAAESQQEIARLNQKIAELEEYKNTIPTTSNDIGDQVTRERLEAVIADCDAKKAEIEQKAQGDINRCRDELAQLQTERAALQQQAATAAAEAAAQVAAVTQQLTEAQQQNANMIIPDPNIIQNANDERDAAVYKLTDADLGSSQVLDDRDGFSKLCRYLTDVLHLCALFSMVTVREVDAGNVHPGLDKEGERFFI